MDASDTGRGGAGVGLLAELAVASAPIVVAGRGRAGRRPDRTGGRRVTGDHRTGGQLTGGQLTGAASSPAGLPYPDPELAARLAEEFGLPYPLIPDLELTEQDSTGDPAGDLLQSAGRRSRP